MSAALLATEDLCVDRGGVRVLEGVSLEVQAGEFFAIVGESGSGKSTLARAALRLVEPSRGRVLWRGRDLRAMSDGDLRAVRREMQIVFQDPTSSLDPRWTVREIVCEPLGVHRIARGGDREEAVLRLLGTVELGPELLGRHPHQLSAGQAQRVALARTLATGPALLIADEALSALDVSIRAQMVNLLLHLRRSLHIACLFISHDLRLAAHVCDRIGVLSRGALVETAPPAVLLRDARHADTQALVAAARALG